MWGLFKSSTPASAPVLAGDEQGHHWKYDDLPTVKKDFDIHTIAERESAIRKKWLFDTSLPWETFQQMDDVLIEQMPMPNSSIHLIRAHGVVKGIDMQALFDDQEKGGLAVRKKLSSDIMRHEQIHKVNNHTYLSLSCYSTPIGVSNREFLTLRTYEKLEDGSHLIMIQSVNYKPRPFDPKFVRGSTRGARCFTPLDTPGDYRLTLVDHVDPRGMIPGFVINYFKKKAGEAILSLRRVYGGTFNPNSVPLVEEKAHIVPKAEENKKDEEKSEEEKMEEEQNQEEVEETVEEEKKEVEE